MITTIIGLDIGHAETAACQAMVTDHRPPQVLELAPGRQSIVTAVATLPNGDSIIGSGAVEQWTTNLALAFKSRDMLRNGAAASISRFVGAIRQRLNAAGIGKDAEYVVGVPSGWRQQARVEYETVLQEAGLTNLRLISESRAALLSAGLPHDEASGRVVVIDIGSSTTDVTFLENLALATEGPKDIGHNDLGGGLIDVALLSAMLERSPDKDKIAGVFGADKAARLRALFAVRTVKEEYFTNEPVYRAHPLYRTHLVTANPRVMLDIVLDAELMDRVIAQPLTFAHTDAAQSAPLSWTQAYQTLLTSARSTKLGGAAQTVVLTGGASRMGFVKAITEQTFQRAAIKTQNEPELDIARGLAMAGRIDAQTVYFEEDANKTFNEEAIGSVIKNRYAEWTEAVAAVFADKLTKLLAEAVKKWRDSPDKELTLRAIQSDVGAEFNQWVGHPDTQLAVAGTFLDWSRKVVNDLRPRIIALMERNHIPISRVDVNPIPPRADVTTGDLLLFVGVEGAAQAVVPIVAATLAGLIGIGLDASVLLTGGFLTVAMTALGYRIGGSNVPGVRNWVLDTHLRKPWLSRKALNQLPDARIDKHFADQKPALIKAFQEQLNDGAKRARIERSIEVAVRKVLGEIREHARLVIAGA